MPVPQRVGHSLWDTAASEALVCVAITAVALLAELSRRMKQIN